MALKRAGLRLLIGALRRLPMHWRQGLAHGLGPLLLQLAPRTRHRLGENLAHALPGLLPSARSTIAREVSQHICQGVLDSFWLEQLALDIEFGDEQARTILQSGGGASVATLHMGCYEVVALALQRLTGRCSTLAKIPPWLGRGEMLYGRVGIDCLDKRQPGVFFRLLDAARAGRYIALHADHHGQDLPVRFFGRNTRAPTGALLLSALARKPLLLGYAWQEGAGRYRVRFETLEAQPPGRQGAALAGALQRLYQRLEQVIRAHPSHWDWSYRRWRPEDQPRPGGLRARSGAQLGMEETVVGLDQVQGQAAAGAMVFQATPDQRAA
ncbi:MAG: lysophospholipid acyltransferase family protein [Roseateles sp.]